MTSETITAEKYIEELPEERKEAVIKLRQILLDNLPQGFEENMGSMMNYVVPFSLYPNGYHCPPKQPLPFISLASQKNFVAFYHMGIYANPDLLEWFTAEYSKHAKYKLDMGKSCIRFKRMDDIPYELITELVTKITPQDWIATYEENYKR